MMYHCAFQISVSATVYSSICDGLFQYLRCFIPVSVIGCPSICYTPIVMPSITHKFVVSKFGGW